MKNDILITADARIYVIIHRCSIYIFRIFIPKTALVTPLYIDIDSFARIRNQSFIENEDLSTDN